MHNRSGIYLAFDFGTKKIGVAVGQYITGTAYPLNILKGENGVPNWKLIELLIQEWEPVRIIVGLPLNMEGTKQLITKRACRFARKIHNYFRIKVSLYDERLSTIEAYSKKFEYNNFFTLSNYKIDSISAVIILESYFRNRNIK